MTILTEVRPFENLAADYGNRGLTARVTDDGQLWTTTTLDCTAIHLPARLGQRTLENLRSRRVAGAVMARADVYGGQDRWTIFCWENHTPRPESVAELDRAGGSICAIGSPLLLPSGYGRVHGEPWWIQPPGAELPGISVVLGVALMVARPW